MISRSPMARSHLLSLLLIFSLLIVSHSRTTPKTTAAAAGDPKNHQQHKAKPKQHPHHLKPNCTGRLIHILPLPPRFNADLLRDCAAGSLPIFSTSSFCHHFQNSGLGPRTHNRSRSWFRTDPLLSLDPLFHRRLLEHPCLTPDPAAAAAVFLPSYSSLSALPLLFSPPLFNSSPSHGLDLFSYIQDRHPRVWRRSLGHDLFMVAGRPAVDLSQDPAADPVLWGTSLLTVPELLNVTVITVEARAFPWQERAVPYVTSFHPAALGRLDSWLARASQSRRPTLALFAGTPGAGLNARARIAAECANRTDLCAVVDCSAGDCAHDPIRFMRPMLRSDFCLQPPGDTPSRRSTFDGILAGCIPVFFEDIAAKSQYGWHLPKREFDQFSVFIPKEDVVFNGVRVLEVLEAIPRARVRQMRERVLALAPSVMYRRCGSSDGLRQIKDAFDITIDGVLRRVRRKVRSLSEPELLYAEDDEDEDDER